MRNLPRLLGEAALILLASAPLAAGLRLACREGVPALELIGRGAGVLGLSFLLLAAALSVRIPGFDVRFGGLTRLWKIHHFLGAAAFLLLMAHPLLLSFAAARTSLASAAAVLFPPAAAWSAWAGWMSLSAMTVFLAPTFEFFGRPEYQRWKALHALSGAAMALGLAHAMTSGRLLPGALGRAVWAAFGGLALLAFVYRRLGAPRLGRRRCTIVRVDAIAPGIVELTLKPDGDPLVYRDGQFIYLIPLAPGLAAGRAEEHPFTLSSTSREPSLRVVIKDLGDASHALQTVPAGSQALIEGPYGEFFPASGRAARELWIAGGIGLTPFLARARGLRESVDIHLIYCVQDESRAHFFSELQSVAARVQGFRLSAHFFGREGALSAAFIAARCPDFAVREIFICGPPALISGARAELSRGGASAARVHSEDFSWL